MADLREENVQNFPRPPVVEPVAQRLRVVLGGAVIADSVRGLRVLETHHAPTYYIPECDILPGALVPASGGSFCEWKGRAQYHDVLGGGRRVAQAAWSYPAPTPGFAVLAGHVAFYCGKMEACFVGAERAEAQPGDFYGGWVTGNLTGIVKGRPGTNGW